MDKQTKIKEKVNKMPDSDKKKAILKSLASKNKTILK